MEIKENLRDSAFQLNQTFFFVVVFLFFLFCFFNYSFYKNSSAPCVCSCVLLSNHLMYTKERPSVFGKKKKVNTY